MPQSRWITRDPAPQAAPPAEDIDTTPTGPTAPTGAVASPEPVHRLSTRRADPLPPGQHWYLGAHGGAGESTLAALDPQGHDAHHVWPVGGRVVLVARETVPGVTRLQHALQHWASGELPPVTLLAAVTVPAAPGRADKAVRDLLHRVAGGAPLHLRVEWHPAFHAVLDPATAPTPRGAARTIRTIQKLSEGAPE